MTIPTHPTPTLTSARSLTQTYLRDMALLAESMEKHGHKAAAADIRAVYNATANCAGVRLREKPDGTADVKSALKAIFASHFCCLEDDITDATKLREDLSADSLDTVELEMAIEEKFNVAVTGLVENGWAKATFGEAAEKLETAIAEGGA